MSFIQMEKEKVLALCLEAKRKTRAGYKGAKTLYLQRETKQKNKWRQRFSLGLLQPFTEEQMHDCLIASYSLRHNVYWEYCHPELNDVFTLAEDLEKACEQADVINMSLNDLSELNKERYLCFNI